MTNGNIEAMIPIWFDSRAVDDQVQYNNCFLFHTHFAATPKPGDVYTRKGHPLFPELSFRPEDFCVARISNTCEVPLASPTQDSSGAVFTQPTRDPYARSKAPSWCG